MYFSLTLTSRKIIIITCLNRMTISVIKTAINMGPVVKRRSSKKLITATVGISRRSHFLTGSRRDVFVVRTSKPVENLWKYGLFWSRYSFVVTHSIYHKPRDWGLARLALRASVALLATCRAPARIWLAVIDFQNGERRRTTKSICVR